MKPIQELINDHIVEGKKEHIGSGKYKPSNLGRCYRLQYWARKNETPTNIPDERLLRVFECGNIFHKWVQGILYPFYDMEQRIETEDFVGYADGVGKEEILELKTVHSYQFHHLDDETISETKLPNILQGMFYAKEFNKKDLRLVFISKDDLCIGEYVFGYDKFEKELKKEIGTLMMWWGKQELPPPEPRAYVSYKIDKKTGIKTKTIKDCAYCMFSIEGKCKCE